MNTRRLESPSCARAAERGAALIVALVFLLIMTVLGVSAMRTTNLQERMAGSLRDSNLAFQAAEAAVREGEQFLEQAALPQFGGLNGLLPMQSGAGQAAFWNGFNWVGNSRPVPGFAGLDQPVAGAPRYVIEELPAVPSPGGSVRFGPLPDIGFYRVTGRGVGGSQDAVSIVQSTYRR